MPKEIEFNLPSGKKVKMRESTGLDQLTARRKFVKERADEKEYALPWEEIAKTIVSIDGIKAIHGYEDLMQLSNKDLIALNYAYNQLNTPTDEEMTELKSFFVSDRDSSKQQDLPVTTSKS